MMPNDDFIAGSVTACLPGRLGLRRSALQLQGSIPLASSQLGQVAAMHGACPVKQPNLLSVLACCLPYGRSANLD